MFWKKESTAANITPLTVTLNASDEGNHQYNLLQTVDHDFNEKTASSGRASKLSRLQSAEQTVRPVDPCSTALYFASIMAAQRRFFTSDGLSIARTRNLTILGKAEGPRFRPSPAMAAHIPAKTSAFKAEPDVTGTLDLIMPAHKLSILAKDTWYDLVLEEKLVIQPHLGSAQVQAVLCNNENVDREEFSGFVIDCVEIRPMAMKIERQDGVSNFYVPRAATPNFIIDTPQLHLKSVDSTCPPAPAPVTKLASSRNSQFLASLSLSKNEAFITIWDMGVIRNPSNPSRNIGKLYKASASAVVYHRGVGDLSIGLSLSTSGDQVAIFQEPKIGEWADGSEVERAVFPFRLFNNPLVPQRSVIVDINTPPNRNMPKNMNTSANNDYDWGNTLASTDSSSENMELQEVRMDLEILHTFIGFGEFLPETRKSDWEKNDVNSALLSSGEGEGTEDNNEDSKEFGVKNIVSQPSTMFAACNGLYLDVFEISADKKWQRLHTITLSDLQPTLSRRITCKMMMEVISSNTFMWLEDDGRSCTIWNLLTGSNITHISSIENAKFKGPTFRGHSKMAISPHESIVALASVDGSLTTYFANTGMAIDDRKFPGYKVEHVGFHAQDDQLFVILRNSATSELSARVLDTLQLKSEIIVNQVPIPTIGSAILAFFYTKGFWNRGIICETDGPLIRCYVTYQPMSSKIIKSNESVLKAEPEDVVYESSLPGEDHIQYRLMTGIHRELLPEGDGVAYWVLRVEVIEENTLLKTQKIIFSFVPEPWMRVTTTEVVHPENLQSTFFVPCGTRFAVVGMQTLQIWNLPTRENNKCSLQFIWSQPRDEKDLGPGGVAFRSTRVRDYYLDTSSTNVYLDTETGNTVAEIKLNDKFRKKSVTIPGPGTIGARYAILFCFRSIHLLAAAYAFSYQESKKSTRETPQVSFTYEDHAEAIVRFTREHINRMMSVGIYSPKKRPPYNNNNSNASSTQQQNNSIRNNSNHSDTPALPHNGIQFVDTPASTTKSAVSEPEAIAMGDNVIHTGTNGRGKDDSDNDNNDRLYRRSNPLNRHHNKPTSKPSVSGSSKLDVVTVLTLLLDHPYLQCTNHIFVEGLLNTDNGDWIPRDNKVLNPIKRAIEAKNGPLVEAFIEYCIKNAKKYHPAYLMPAVQCLNELSDRYPKILVDMFRKASYVPAHNHNYVSSHALIANPQYKQWLLAKLKFWNMFSSKKWEKSNIINDYERPVFSLRSQLPFRASSFMNILNIETSVRDERAKKFPPKQDVGAEEKKQMQSPYSHKIYVAPFPKLSMYGPYRPWFRDATESAKSAFTDIAGRDFFDSPAMVATLDFKWHKFGFFYWFLRFLVVLTFFILVVVITAQQIRVMSIDEPVRLTAEDIEIRYMNSWRPVFKATIVVGCLLAGYEVIQFLDAPKKYYKSPYNYMDLAAYVAPVIGCILFLRDTPNGKPDDGGPDQIWIMSFSILALYINIVSRNSHPQRPSTKGKKK
ncbi:hypothetical protein BX616_003896 [Lobosporangium transversale]|nr:hypothetical protein BX616_003896 [Lobosporangium transversale]